MDTVDLKLAQDCEALAVAASEGVAWLKGAAQQSPTVAQQAPSLVSELQKVRNQSRKLARAARRRMCVGVFGPSQAGKSYLVSILASRDGRPLQARFADGTYDFLREINPPGNRESTGLVTRFGLGLSDVSTDFPVRVRLLTQTDIVKILGNSFLLDFDHQKAAFERPRAASFSSRCVAPATFASSVVASSRAFSWASSSASSGALHSPVTSARGGRASAESSILIASSTCDVPRNVSLPIRSSAFSQTSISANQRSR